MSRHGILSMRSRDFAFIGLVLLLSAASIRGAPLVFSIQPASQSVLPGSNVNLTAATSGGQGPIAYRWLFEGNTLTNNSRISGVDTPVLTISNFTASDAGTYHVAASDNHSGILSSGAVLTVLIPLAINANPTNQVIPVGTNAVFSAVCSGNEPLTYRWQKNGTNLADNLRVRGASSPTLTISNLQMSDAGNYRLILTNAYGMVASDESSLAAIPIFFRGFFSLLDVPATLTNAIAVSAGSSYNLGLKQDGTVVAWGGNGYGQEIIPPGLSDVVAISAGQSQSLALRSNRTVVAWGDNDFGQTNVPVTASNFVAIAAGNYHSLALRDDGTVFGCGYNYDGEVSIPYSLIKNAVAIAAGGFHSVALRNDGTVAVWGRNDYGQTNVPLGLTNVVAIAAAESQTMALKADGTVIVWGANDLGQTNVPAGLSNVVAIAAGYKHSLALRADGKVVGWGDNSYGQSSLPNNLERIVSISGGFYSTLALVENPTVHAPPSIWWQSSNVAAQAGQPVLFKPCLNGSLPMQFQWYFDETLLPAETNQWLMLSAVPPEQSGVYRFVVTNNYGSVTGQVFLGVGPVIVTQPVSQTIIAGGNATFSVLASGPEPLSYQWQGKANAATFWWSNLARTNSSFTLSNVPGAMDGQLYRVIVTNAYGAITSAVSMLTVHSPPAFTGQPTGKTNAVGSSATFTATVTGTQPITFQWYGNGQPLTSGGRISISSNSTTSYLTISGLGTNDSGGYYLVASNFVGATSSSIANLKVIAPPSILQNPSDQSVTIGSNATFSVDANGTEPLAYQWLNSGAIMMHGGQVSGATSSLLTLANLTIPSTNSYSVVITNFAGAVTSTPASLTVYGVKITSQPTNRIVNLGSNTTFAVSVIGQTPLSYQWYFNGLPLADDIHFSGSTMSTLSLSNSQYSHVGSYSVLVSNLWGAAASTNAMLKLRPNHSNAVFYVNQNNPTPQAPFLDWSTAATNIQDAAELAIDGNLILVTNGIYGSGGTSVAGANTRVNLINGVTLRSINGPEATVIVGGGYRCVFAGNNAVLSGFTVTNGLASAGGGGVWCEAAGVVTNCLIQGNSAGFNLSGGGISGGIVFDSVITGNSGYSGGGAYRARLFNCTISSNSTISGGYGTGAGAYQCVLSNCLVIGNNAVYSASGGGTSQGTNYHCTIAGNFAGNGFGGGGTGESRNFNCNLLNNRSASYGGASRDGTNYNCLITGNVAYRGGGVYGGAHFNCTIANNSVTNLGGGSSGSGGGAYSASLYNSILINNTANTGSNWLSIYMDRCWTAPSGFITNVPDFVDPGAGDFRLQPNSPGINAGNNAYATSWPADLDGNPRIVGYAVDIGAYEKTPASIIPNSWLFAYGYSNDGSADGDDTDGDGLSSFAEWKAGTIPTNAISALRLAPPSKTVSGLVVTWESVSGVRYHLQRSTNLPGGFSTIVSNRFAVTNVTSHTDTSATNASAYFYRVGVK